MRNTGIALFCTLFLLFGSPRPAGAQKAKKSAAVSPAEIARLIRLLADPDDSKGYAAGNALGQMGEDAALELFKAVGQTKDKTLRKMACFALGKVRQKALKDKDDEIAKAVEDFLLSALEDPSDDLVWAAAAGLMAPPASKRAIRAFITVLKDENRGPMARWNTLGNYDRFGPEAAEAIPFFIDWLDSRKDKKGSPNDVFCERAVVCKVLAAIGPKDERVLAALKRTLKNRPKGVSGKSYIEDLSIRGTAAYFLIELGAGEDARADLFGILDETLKKKKDNEIGYMRGGIVKTIGRLKTIGGINFSKEEVERLLVIALDQEERTDARGAAIATIGDLAPASDYAWLPFLNLLQGERTATLELEKEIIIALGKFGPAASEAAPTLERMMRHAEKVGGFYRRQTEDIRRTLKKIEKR